MSDTSTACKICPPPGFEASDSSPPPTAERKQPADVSSSLGSSCLVCYSKLHPYTTKTPCDHNQICAICHLRLRHLHDDKKCPICKAPNEQLIVDRVDNAEFDTFDDYPVWGDQLGSGFIFRHDVGMFFPVEYYESDIQPLFGYQCGAPGCDFDGASSLAKHDAASADEDDQQDEEDDDEDLNVNQNTPRRNNKKSSETKTPLKLLQDHLRVAHRTALCLLCVTHSRDFVARLPRFTRNQVKRHLNQGDGPRSGFTGHPVCEFCRPKRFYDLTLLYEHLAKDHYKCDMCAKQGLDHQYFKNYKSLERHFDSHHFLCHDVQCMMARFVVFNSELDLRHHERTVHGGTSSGSSKIQLEFRVRRGRSEPENQEVPTAADFDYGLDGQAFSPAPLPTTTETDSDANAALLHPLHVQRTAELREMAAERRPPAPDSFPTLQQASNEAAGTTAAAVVENAEATRLRVGWTEGTALKVVAAQPKPGAVNEESFPSLPKPAAKPKAAASARPRGPTSAAASITQQLTNLQAQQNWGGGGTSAAAAVRSAATTPLASRPAAYAPSLGSASAGGSFAVSAAGSAAANNSKANLTSDNFPALAPSANQFPALGSGPGYSKKAGKKAGAGKQEQQPYAAAQALAAKNAKLKKTTKKSPAVSPMMDWASASQFPTLAGGSNAALTKPLAAAPAPRQQAAPSFDSAVDFPSMARAAPTPPQNGTQLRDEMGKGGKKPPPPAAGSFANAMTALPVPTEESMATVQDMKAAMGAAGYKKLKQATKQFATGELSPVDYVTQAATLFDQGAKDPDFVNFVGSLLESLPDGRASKEALDYMIQLRINQRAGSAPSAPVPSLAAAAPSQPTAPAPRQQAPPEFDSAADFPSIAPAAPATRVTNGMKPPTLAAGSFANAMSSVPAPTEENKATVQDMKAAMGAPSFKNLKQATKQFAAGEISPVDYVTQTASLFDQGARDPDFIRFVGSLLESIPDERASKEALEYMIQLRINKGVAPPPPAPAPSSRPVAAAPKPAPAASAWSTSASRPSKAVTAAPPSSWTAPPSSAPQPHPAAAVRYAPPARGTGPNAKKNAWGAGKTGAAVVSRPTPGSVAAAAASGPKVGTATKYMANQNKVAAHQPKKKKAGGNQQLRDLAFGGK